ncbi:MAG: hypothetical protein J6R47_03410, partial [Acholeplasmatales bacterium]|nr:hypothetical protein [Acholeplasmatales bacterium]
MELNIEKNTVTIYSKNYKLDQIAAKLAQLNGSQVYSFFTNRGIFVPRKLNCYAMISILNDKLKLLNSNSLSKDYFTRLQYYKSFSELQLYNLYKEIATFDDFKNYRISLFKLVLYNYVGLNLTDGELQYLINLKKLPMESFEEYFDQVSCACFEQENTFDGQDIDVLKENLEFSAANTEITGLGDKYGIPVPQRLKKTDILEYLYWYLGKQNKLTRDLKQSLDVMTITEISNYIKNENVGISANMTKAELVNYLFFILSQYDIPATTMKRVEILEEYEPLEFKVDLNAVSNFKTDQPKKVIHFKHDSSDDEYYEALSDLYHTTMQQSEIVEEEESVKKLTLEHEAIIPTVQKKMSIADIKARQMGVQSKFQGVEESDDEEFIPALDNDPELDIENSSEEDAILKKAGLDTMDEEIRKAQEEAKIQEAKAKEAEEKARLEAEAKAKNKAQREAEEKRAAEEKAKAEAEKKARDAQILAQAQAYVKQYEARMKKMQEAEAKKQQAQQAAKAITQKKIVKTITKPNGEKVTLEFTPEQFAALKAKKAAELAGQPVDVASIVKAQAAQKAREEALKAKAQSKVVQEQQV